MSRGRTCSTFKIAVKDLTEEAMLSQFRAALSDPLLRVAFLSIMLMGPAIASVIPFQSVIGVERLGLSDGVYALVTTLGAIFGVAAAVVIGILTDQTGRYRGILVLSILSGIAAGALMLMAPAAWAFILVHVLMFPVAITAFTQYFALAAVAADRNPHMDRDAALSLVRAAFAGSFAIAPPIWAIALARGADLLSVYGVFIAANLGVLAIIFLMWPRDHAGKDAGDAPLPFFAALAEVTTGRILLRIGLVAVISSVNGLYNILLGLMVVTQLGGTEANVGWFAGGVAAVELPVMLAAALLVKRFSRRGLILAGVVIYAAAMAGLAVVPSMAWAWGLILPFGIGAGIILSVPVAYVQSLVAHRPGAGSSLLSLTHLGGITVASGVFAAGAASLSYSGVAVLGAVLALGSGYALYKLD